MSDLKIFAAFDPDRDLWLAVILQGNEVKTLGYEPTQAEAAEWGRKAIQARAWESENDDPPDFYARAALGEKE